MNVEPEGKRDRQLAVIEGAEKAWFDTKSWLINSNIHTVGDPKLDERDEHIQWCYEFGALTVWYDSRPDSCPWALGQGKKQETIESRTYQPNIDLPWKDTNNINYSLRRSGCPNFLKS
jgi:hypothetical protein